MIWPFLLKRSIKKFHFVHYDPNPNSTSKIVIKFRSYFGKNDTNTYGFHALDNNVSGTCTFSTWINIIDFVIKLNNPFDRIDLKRYCSSARKYFDEETMEKHLATKCFKVMNVYKNKKVIKKKFLVVNLFKIIKSK